MDEKENISVIKEIIRKYIDLLQVSGVELLSAYLFGSYAKNKHNKFSDIDLALILPRIENRFKKSVDLTLLGSKIDSRIEPHLFLDSEFEENGPFVQEILREGIKIL
jgi:uncharacterized protein